MVYYLLKYLAKNIEMRLTKIFIILILLAVGCSENQNSYNKLNICQKDLIQKISYLTQNQSIPQLIELLQISEDNTKPHILLSISDIDFQIGAKVATAYINHKDENIRYTAAFVIGQSYNSEYTNLLIEQFKIEHSDYVKTQIIQAIGKCANTEQLVFFENLKFDLSNESLISAFGQSIYQIGLKGFITENIVRKIFDILQNPNISWSAKEAISRVFSVKKIYILDLNRYFKTIKNELQTNDYVFYTINLVKSLNCINSEETLNFLEKFYNISLDFRIKLSILELLDNKNIYSQNIFEKALEDKHPAISLKAAEILEKKFNKTSDYYLNLSKKITSWQTRIKLLSAALKNSSTKSFIVNTIKQSYNSIENPYEKGLLLTVLQWTPEEINFLKEQVFNSADFIISKYALETLLNIYKNFKSTLTNQQKTELELVFKEVMISSNNPVLIGIATEYYMLNIDKLQKYSNIYFLEQSLSQLKLPADFLVYKNLCKLLNIISAKQCTNFTPKTIQKTDFQKICNYNFDIKITIKTNKGTMKATLFADYAPWIVEYFLQLVDAGFYRRNYFSDYIPGKAIILGGQKGDGSLILNKTLIQNIYPLDIDEGYIAFNNLGDNYISPNFLITLSKIFEYNDRYTFIGKITEGLHILHSLEIGDYIEKIEIN